ncbi:MAG: DUF1566 domain-containing protein [Bacteroidales bacterium]|nr:DUF1566 domain-containing protein [Bacteroidales bacterium]
MKNLRLSKILSIILVFTVVQISAQVAINTDGSLPDNSAMLDVKSSAKGVLIPRMTQTQIEEISNPANGLQVFCTTDSKLYIYNATPGQWKEIAYGAGTILPVTLPVVTTSPVTGISQTNASSGGTVTSDGGANITARGVCWGTSINPTIANSHTGDGSGTGTFISTISGLTANTPYYLRSYATNRVGTSYGNELSFTTLSLPYIGQSFQGGIIFYIDGTGQHGLIAATSDQSTGAPYGCYGYSTPGTSTAIGTGQANTNAILNACGDAVIAARICRDLVLNGYDDWFLPSRDELVQMYIQRSAIGGFAVNDYWSSSEIDPGSGWEQNFAWDGQTHMQYKGNPGYVRAIRAF